MEHKFTPSQLDSAKCARCKYSELDHTERATCETCGNSGNCEIYIDMLMCQDCLDKEKQAQIDNNTPEAQQARIDAHNAAINNHRQVLDKARAIDQTIQVKSDFFNAETVELEKIRQAINENPEITNKSFAIASEFKTRIEHFQKVMFDKRQELEAASSAHRAIQTQLNEIANKLRQDEREKLKIQDINYKVEAPKVIKARAQKSERKWNKADVREAAAEYKVPIDAVQMICVARNMHPKDAAHMLAKQIYGVE